MLNGFDGKGMIEFLLRGYSISNIDVCSDGIRIRNVLSEGIILKLGSDFIIGHGAYSYGEILHICPYGCLVQAVIVGLDNVEFFVNL